MRAGTPSSGLLLRPIKDWVHGFWCYTMAKTWINFRMSLITGLLDVEKVWSVTWVAETRFFFVLILPKWGWSSWSHGLTEELLHHLNGVRPTIKFTVEQEEDGTLPFLNTLLRRREDGSLDVSVYRKPTHTDRYLHFESHHPTLVKRGVVRCLDDRARGIINMQDNLQKGSWPPC